MEALVSLVIWLGLAIGAGAIASSKGRSGFGYFVLALFLPLIGFLIAAFIAPRSKNGEPLPPGTFIDCKSCLRPYRNTLSECPHCRASNGEMWSGPQQKKCPACAELILAEARKCKHCGEMQPVPEPAAEMAVLKPAVGSMGYCPDCKKLRHSSVAKCVYCSSTNPVPVS
jgi:hypothetical protein